MNTRDIEQYLAKLGEVYDALEGKPLTISICGGAALMALGLVDRTTKDIDLVAPLNLPAEFTHAARVVADEYGLPADWINQGPKQLTEMGLPEGFEERASEKKLSNSLTARFASRRDQIFFKLYAAVDRGGYHAEDLVKLEPTDEELLSAARWCMTHDVSEAFRELLKDMLTKLGYHETARSL